MEVDQVELLLHEQPLDLQVGAQRQGDARHRPVGRDRHHATDAVDSGAQLEIGLASSSDEGAMMCTSWPRRELLGQVGDVLGDAAGIGEVVRRHECDLHD